MDSARKKIKKGRRLAATVKLKSHARLKRAAGKTALSSFGLVSSLNRRVWDAKRGNNLRFHRAPSSLSSTFSTGRLEEKNRVRKEGEGGREREREQGEIGKGNDGDCTKRIPVE